MAIELKVPSMVCDGCVEKITTEIKKSFPEADININLDNKLVSIDTTASETEIKEIITATGHTVE
jgi:copper chaperone